MSSIEIRGLEEVRQLIADLPENLFDQTKEIFKVKTFAAHREVTGNLVAGPLYSRTGLLRKSLSTEVSGSTLQNLRAGIYAGRYLGGQEIVYAPIHEFGGTIRAKRAYMGLPGGPYLNIPTRKNKTPAGVTRLSAKEVFNQGGYIVKMKSGVFGVFLSGELMYTLHKEVKIPARLGMRKAVDDEIPTLVSQLRKLQL